MNKPISQVTVTLSAEDAADLQARVERGEFASLDEGIAAELAELNYRRAADIVGGSEKLEALLDELEANDDPSTDVDAFDFLEGLRAKYTRMAEGLGEPPAGVAEEVDAVRLSIQKSIADDSYEDAEIVSARLRHRFGEAED
jgi:Arc/MetJ-type ribon-helix-helix transcriptional regulator